MRGVSVSGRIVGETSGLVLASCPASSRRMRSESSGLREQITGSRHITANESIAPFSAWA